MCDSSKTEIFNKVFFFFFHSIAAELSQYNIWGLRSLCEIWGIKGHENVIFMYKGFQGLLQTLHVTSVVCIELLTQALNDHTPLL